MVRTRQLWLNALALLFMATALHAQDAPPAGGQRRGGFGGGQFAGMQRVNGEITAVNGATLTLKSEDGTPYQVVTTDNTRVLKGRTGVRGGDPSGGTVKVSDLKVGDGLIAMGNLDAPNKTLHAALLMATDAAELKALKENLGKTYIIGKVTAVDLDNAKMTVLRQDGVSQTIGFDETTSFRRGRVNLNAFAEPGPGFNGPGGGRRGGGAAGAPPEDLSITLADIKIGDTVAGRGALKAGTFVPAELTVATPGQGRRRGPGAPPDGTTPPPPAPPTGL